jgi:hypothetical protein
MQKIDSSASLRAAIIQLEIRKAEEEEMLKAQFQATVESMKPIRVINNIIDQAIGLTDSGHAPAGTKIGLAAGFLSRMLFQVLTKNPVKKLIGTALVFGLTKIVVNNPEAVRSISQKVFQFFRSKSAHKITENGTIII